jgi:hypothetical protein
MVETILIAIIIVVFLGLGGFFGYNRYKEYTESGEWVKSGKWASGVTNTKLMKGYTLVQAKAYADEHDYSSFIYSFEDKGVRFGGIIKGDGDLEATESQVFSKKLEESYYMTSDDMMMRT